MEYISIESEDGGGAYKSCLYIQCSASTSFVVSFSSRVLVADSLSVYTSRPIHLIFVVIFALYFNVFPA